MYVTNDSNRLELLIENGVHIILSPDEPDRFISEIDTIKKEKPHNNIHV